MASTYSTSLRLELMGTGDQSGTWGVTTNTNLGTLLEQAITGVLSVAQGDVANLTLTASNGASDQARNAVVNLTGAMTAARNVVVPTANKSYTFVNSTTGGFSVTAKTTAGTGVSIPPGASVNVYCDGTNVVMGQNYWNGQIGGAVYVDAGAAVGPVMDLFRDSSSPAASDILGQVIFNGRDSAANKQEYGSIQAVISDATSTSEDSVMDMYVLIAGTRTKILSLASPGALLPGGNDTVALGSTAAQWSDLFLAEGGVINWDNGDMTMTQVGNLLTVTGGNTQVDNLQFATATGILDDSGNEQLLFVKTASAVPYWQMTNAATGGKPVLAALGETNIIGQLTGNGTGGIEIKGTGTNDDATAGYVGQCIESNVAGPGSSITSGATANITSISLTAGDWDVFGNIAVVYAGTGSAFNGGINTTSVAFATQPGAGANTVLNVAFGAGTNVFIVGQRRLVLNATTTVYLVVNSTFTSTATAYGYIAGRRRR